MSVHVHVSPVLRRARLIEITPPPGPERAEHYATELIDAWRTRREEFLRLLAALGKGLEPDCEVDAEVAREESVRLRPEGDTVIVDYPRCSILVAGSVAVEIRLCVAFCTRDKASKAWARVSEPPPREGRLDLAEVIDADRGIAVAAAEWIAGHVMATVTEAGDKATPTGDVEVTSVTTDSRRVREYFALLVDPGTGAADILMQEGAEEYLTRYFREVIDLPLPLRELSKRPEEYYWFSSPIGEEGPDRLARVHDVLYIAKESPSLTQLVGLGFSESPKSQLSKYSSLKVARLIGHRV